MRWFEGLWDKRLKQTGPGQTRLGTDADLRYLVNWTASRIGVEAYVEPRTNVSDITVMLIAADGEWTRRRVGGEAGARRLSNTLRIPVYDVNRLGYPQRKRDYDARQRIVRRRGA